MATDNPELQEKLQELEHELEVSKLVSVGNERLGYCRVLRKPTSALSQVGC